MWYIPFSETSTSGGIDVILLCGPVDEVSIIGPEVVLPIPPSASAELVQVVPESE